MFRLLQIVTAERIGLRPINSEKCKMDTLTDRELVQMAKEGEQRAFAILMERYGKGLTLHIGEYMANCRSCGMEMAEEPEDI